MIVVDTSALIAIIQNEPDGIAYRTAIKTANRVLVSAVSLFEAAVVLHARSGAVGTNDLAELIDAMGIDVVPFDEAAARGALDAFRTYGKGVHPRARLNICDCAAYGIAKAQNAPLLFKGDDFAATDVVRAHV